MKTTKHKGVDVVFDTVGGALFKPILKCIKWAARIVIVGFASGRWDRGIAFRFACWFDFDMSKLSIGVLAIAVYPRFPRMFSL